MNKKIKLSILGTLFIGSALAVTMPIVSCSSSTPAPDPTTILTVTGTQDPTITGPLVRSLSKTTGEKINSQMLAEITRTIAPNSNNTDEKKILDTLDSQYIFHDGETKVAFLSAIENVVISGELPTISNEDVKVKVTINLKSTFTTTTNLTQEVIIGTTATILTTTANPNPTVTGPLVRAISTIEGAITDEILNTIINTKINHSSSGLVVPVWNALASQYSFKNGETDVRFLDAVDSIVFAGTLPTGTKVDVKVMITINLKSTFTTTTDLTQEVIIGKTA